MSKSRSRPLSVRIRRKRSSPYAHEVLWPEGNSDKFRQPNRSLSEDDKTQQAVTIWLPFHKALNSFTHIFAAFGEQLQQSWNSEYILRESTERGDTFQIRRSRYTLLPLYLRIALGKNTPQSDSEAVEIARTLLQYSLDKSMISDDRLIRATTTTLTGQDRPISLGEPIVTTTIMPRSDDKAIDHQSDDHRYHISFAQQYQNLPVYGGTITVHLQSRQPITSFTSTFLPIPDTLSFVPQISVEEALATAWNTLRHYQPKLPEQAPELNQSEEEYWHNWSATIRYHGNDRVPSPLVIVPFNNSYHLAYEIHISAPRVIDAWKILVDAQQPNLVLGQPQSLVSHINTFIFAKSRDIKNNTAPSLPIELNGNPCQDFLEVYIYDPNNLKEPKWEPANPPSPEFDAINVAGHAHIFYQYLQNVCGADKTLLNRHTPFETTGTKPQLQVIVNSSSSTGFKPTFLTKPDETTKPAQISFKCEKRCKRPVQKSNGDIAPWSPAHDPEIIYHEIAHGLMWKINPDPFEDFSDSPKIASALREGYATYFARSCALGNEAPIPPESIWAEGAYPRNDALWALNRLTTVIGEDQLVGNILQEILTQPSDPKVYQAGMIWARSLWDLRQLIGQEADCLALNAYNYARGWTSSFAAVAEGLIESAERLYTGEGLSAIIRILLAGRGILADSAIQAIASHEATLLVATNTGIMRFDSNLWYDWSATSTNALPLTGLTALVIHPDPQNPICYAATSEGIYQRPLNDTNGWTKVGEWTGDWSPLKNPPGDGIPEPLGPPLSLALTNNGELYAGTGLGIWFWNTSTEQWKREPNSTSTLLQQLICLDLRVLANGELCAATYNGLYIGTRRCELLKIVTCVVRSDTMLIVGTAGKGVFQVDPNNVSLPSLQLTISGVAPDQHVILDLAIQIQSGEKQVIYAATPQGVFAGTSDANSWTWTHLSNGWPQQAPAIVLHIWNKQLYAGTLIHGLWRLEAGLQKWVSDNNSILSSLLTLVTLPLEGPLPSKQRFFPIQLLEQAKIIVQTEQNISWELWSLDLNGDKLDPTVSHTPGLYAIKLARSTDNITIKTDKA